MSAQQQTFNVELPNGMILQDIPIGTTKEQIQQKLSAKGIDLGGTATQKEEDKGFLSRVSDDLGRRMDIAKQYGGQLAAGEKTLPEAAVKYVGNVGAGVINDITSEGVRSVFNALPNAIQDPIKEAGKNLAQSYWGGLAGKGIESAKEFANENPGAAEYITAAGNVAALPVINKAGKSMSANMPTNLYSASKKAFDANRAKAIQDLISPVKTQKVLEEEVGRTKMGGGLLNKKVVEPTPYELEMADTAAKVGVSPNKTFQANYNIIQDGIAKEADSLIASLQKADTTIAADKINSSMNDVLDRLKDNPYLTGDAETSAKRVISGAMKIIGDGDKTAAELLEARKSFDNWVKSQKGGGALDPIRDTPVTSAVREIRQAINETIANNVESVPVKESLRKQSVLYRALDNIRPKAAQEAKTNVGRAGQKVSEAVPVLKLTKKLVRF